MYFLPSTSTSVAPEARAMKRGEPPTDLNARTGLSTPPGSNCCAREKSFCDRVVFMDRHCAVRSHRGTAITEVSVIASVASASLWLLDKTNLLACHRRETRTGERR